MSEQIGVETLVPPAAVESPGEAAPPVTVMMDMKGLGRRAFGEAKALGKRAFGEANEAFAEAKDTGRHMITEAQDVGLRTSKAVKSWWEGLPKDGVHVGIVAGTALVIGLIPALVIIAWRRGAP